VTVELSTSPFDPYARLRAHEATLPSARAGAQASFVGHMRDHNAGDAVIAMRLDHYPGMTERELARLASEATVRWDLIDTLIVHRVGEIAPGEAIVLCAAWAAHRAEAFEACRFLMEELKHRAPFWKRETLADGSTRWVEQNTPGETQVAPPPARRLTG
jgi:molybdopterin synthase catalytic subunit